MKAGFACVAVLAERARRAYLIARYLPCPIINYQLSVISYQLSITSY
ncbi:MAG: hypothetical protein AAF630_15430 [Cyanobacteria bacterium P01_C01_bin.38]